LISPVLAICLSPAQAPTVTPCRHLAFLLRQRSSPTRQPFTTSPTLLSSPTSPVSPCQAACLGVVGLSGSSARVLHHHLDHCDFIDLVDSGQMLTTDYTG
jgi:hypothetical protein